MGNLKDKYEVHLGECMDSSMINKRLDFKVCFNKLCSARIGKSKTLHHIY